MHVLEGLSGAVAGRRIFVPPGGLSVGKRVDNDLCLQDEFVSRAHARFDLLEEELWLTDLGSTNGTFVNELQVQRRRLRAGDRVQIGSSLLEYRNRPVAVIESDRSSSGSGPQPTVMRTVREPPPSPVAPPVAPEAGPSRAMAALADLARARPGALAPEEALGRILELTFEVVPAERGCVVLLGEDGSPTTRAVRYRQPGAAADDMPLSRTLLDRAVGTGSAMLIADALADAGLGQAASVLAHRLRCVAYVPLVFAEEAIGALCLDTQVPNGLREEHLDPLVGFANQASIVAYQARMQERIRQELQRRERFQRFLSPAVVEQLLAAGTEPTLGGEERETTILFADLRGFTSLAEKVSPREAVSLLNMLFERLSGVVLAHGGTLDKYIGDCIMALFGAPVADPQHCVTAVRAALEMQREMAALRQELASRYEGLSVGIAINTGPAVVGNIGSDMKMDYTAIGDAVNVAARVEDLAGPGQILVTDAVARAVAATVHLQPATTVALRGREQSTALYLVHSLRANGPGARRARWSGSDRGAAPSPPSAARPPEQEGRPTNKWETVR